MLVELNFNSLYKENYNNVLNYINCKIHSIVDAEEITNDVFVKVNKHLNNFDESKSKFTTWLRMITNQCIIDFYRADNSSQYSNVSDFVNSEGDETFQFTDDNETNSGVESNEIKVKILRAIKKLNPVYKSIAYIYFLKGMKYNEISETFNIPMGTVKGCIFRVREMLQSELKNVRSNVLV